MGKLTAYLDAGDDIFDAIRSDFYKKYQSNVNNEKYHPRDLERLNQDGEWIRAFFKHAISDNDRTVDMLNEVFLWRKEFGANDLLTGNTLPFPDEILKRGFAFLYNHDKDGTPLVHFAVRMYKRGMFTEKEIYKCLAFHFERQYRFNVFEPIVILFDCTDAGLSNLDMKMMEFVVTCLKTYYPGLIQYMICFQLPFILNTAWKIIKNWLPPEAIKIIKFTDKKTIREYIAEDQLLVGYGGTDKYKYEYNAKDYKMPVLKLDSEGRIISNENEESKTRSRLYISTVSSNTTLSSPSSSADKTIEEETKPVINDLSDLVVDKEIVQEEVEANRQQEEEVQEGEDKYQKYKEQVLAHKALKKLANGGKVAATTTAVTATANGLASKGPVSNSLIIEPRDEIKFDIRDAKTDITQHIKLTNPTDVTYAYKIKITSPDKFRVKPGSGLIAPSGGTVQITINFLKDFHSSQTHRDKFLVLWAPVVERVHPSELNEFWKTCAQKKIEIKEHKLKCIIIRPNEPSKPTTTESIVTNSPTGAANGNNLTSASEVAATAANNNNKTASREVPTVSVAASAMPVKPRTTTANESRRTIQPTGGAASLRSSSAVEDLNGVNSRLNQIETAINSIERTQEKLREQYSMLLFLIYFIIFLNLIQLLFQSNVFNQIIEPFIDSYLFQKPSYSTS